ncbi:serine protease nudel [Anopheles bellator]|uniref:serine protease nudel n=1 Tax=Anopheles bellator TaxID=139047 RepID=UPI002647848C|nr:serine protease nudel [Anopheles bellator]
MREKRANPCWWLLAIACGLFVVSALTFACYLTLRCTGTRPTPVNTEHALIDRVYRPSGLFEYRPEIEPRLDRPQDDDHQSLAFFQTEGYEVVKRSLQLLEYMEQLEPLLSEDRRQRRNAPDLPNRIERKRDGSEEVVYGVRRRTQREQDLGTLPIVYVGSATREAEPQSNSISRQKRQAVVNLAADRERVKRDAKQDYQRLEREYNRCRKAAPNGKICDQIYDKLQRLSDEVNARFLEMSNLLQGIQEAETSSGKTVPPYPAVFFSTAPPTESTDQTSAADHSTEQSSTYATSTDRKEGAPNPRVAQYDPQKHRPIENSSIHSLEDLFAHLWKGMSTTSSTSSSTATTEQSTTPTENPASYVSSTTGTTKSSRWTSTKSPLPSARNLHDVVNQLQLAQMLQPHPFHEDMVQLPQPPASINEFVMTRSRNRDHNHHDHHFAADLDPEPVDLDSPGQDSSRSSHHQHQQPSPLLVGPSAPFLSLCDQLRSANGGGGGGLTRPGQGQGHGFQHAGSLAPGIPITGEATKASSQIIVNSAYAGPATAYMPNPVCFYHNGPPTNVPYPFRPAASTNYPTYANGGYPSVVYQQPGGQHSGAGGKLPPLNDPTIEALIHPRFAEATIHMPVSIHNLQQSGARDGSVAAASSSPGHGTMLLCSLVQSDHRASVPQPDQTFHRQQHANETDTAEDSAELASMFASGHSSAARAKGRQHCRRGWVSCFSSHQCVKRSAWCDSKTDCMDGSDESACSCVSRLPRRKLCDGYADCPLGMDEMGCFGCDKFAFSCFHTPDEAGVHGGGQQCYSLRERCDGVDHCLSRKDEQDCSMLVRDLGHYLAYSVPHTSGVLHRNHRGKWYPVCRNAVRWAREACEAEVGPLDREPQLSHGHGSLPGPYISPANPQPEFSDGCNGVYVHVKCPPVRCGTSKLHERQSARIRVRSASGNGTGTPNEELVESVRIVGGSNADPEAYPFIVGIFRDGKYHCGASIYNEHWIISAAHCCDHFHRHHYEVRSGMLRKRSFAPQVQVTHVTHMIVHHAYSSTLMANDIALMRVETPFHYNRWVRPICLPEKHRTTGDRDWIWGPKPGTVCTAIGWGALREQGGAPDHLKQVSVPILAVCKHKNDRDSLQICAADEDGGHDACQGDSGGPFVCQSRSNPYEWFLAGVVSHGEGCARAHEPGVYTRVALFNEWIEQKVHEPLPARTARADCPGTRCIWGGGICLPRGKRCNGFVNCLGGEDESGCGMDQLLRSMANRGEQDTDEEDDHEEDDEHTELSRQMVDDSSVTPEAAKETPEETTTVATTEQSTVLETTERKESSPTDPSSTTDTTVEPTAEGSSAEGQESVVVTHTVHVEWSTTPLTTPTTAGPSVASGSPPTATTDSPSTEGATTESQDALEFEILADPSTTTEALWKAVEKTIKEVQGLARARNDSKETPESDLPDHPFFEEIEVMQEQKQKRMAQFRMTVHNLHTKSPVTPAPPTGNETAVHYRQFECRNITQRINVAHRCDRLVDCEDGSDELNCTCRDFLKDKFDFLICDGKTDCLDHTDEKDCMHCKVDQYACRMSQVCVPREQTCNGHPDCPLHEDELDCLALTDGHRVYFDANNLTLFRNSGLVTKNTNGTWEVLCGTVLTAKTEHAVEKICSFLGFAGYRNYSLLSLGPDAVLPEELPASADVVHSVMLTVPEGCQALRVTCAQHINATEHEIAHFEHQPQEEPVQVNIRPLNPIHRPHHMPQIVFQENAHVELIENFGDDYDWPWNADVYLDGVLICSGLIIDASWIVVASSCTRLVNMRHQYVAAVAGGAKPYLHIAGPYEQVVRVDCYHFIPEAETVMLHLAQKLTFSRHVLPTFIPASENVTDSECLAVGKDKYGRTKTLRVHQNDTNCEGERVRCYHKDLRQPYFHHEFCYTQEAARSGVIVCKTKRSGWYPVGFYQNKRGLCGFNEVVRVTSLVESYHRIQHVLNHEQCRGELYYEEPPCAGMRCRYGKCIGKSLVCDRKADCAEGSDEQPELCAQQNATEHCLPHQMRCANGRCVEKAKFCDRKNDCGDSTDEPHDCSCYTYLRITDPGKICDGVRNCYDKSDENPRVCRCHAGSFRCGESDICVPYDFVCDRERDCPNGEDEQYCYALQQNSYEAGYGELMEQSFGIWHSKCFPKTAQFGDEYMRDICEQLGYGQVRKIYGRAIVEQSRLRTANSTDSPAEKLRRAATKTIVQNKFSKVVINGNHTFYMKPSRPMFKVINWNYHDEQNCHRLELLCAP